MTTEEKLTLLRQLRTHKDSVVIALLPLIPLGVGSNEPVLLAPYYLLDFAASQVAKRIGDTFEHTHNWLHGIAPFSEHSSPHELLKKIKEAHR
jgi:hypothetical protein